MKLPHKWFFIGLLIAGHSLCFAQQVQVVKFPALQKMMAQKGDTTLVVNFWATWCGPCVAELPYFEALNARYAQHKVKVLLVNLDFVSELKKKVVPFITKRRMNSSTVVLLDEPNYNSWIDKIDPNWSGALPFTVIINTAKNERKVFERAFTKAELENELKPFIQ